MQASLTMELQKQCGLWSQTCVEQPWAPTKLQLFYIGELKQECSTVDESILLSDARFSWVQGQALPFTDRVTQTTSLTPLCLFHSVCEWI